MHLFNFHHYHLHDLHLFRLHGMKGMYLNHLFRRIATTMIGLYIPIYIYNNFNSYDYVFGYYLMVSFWAMIMMFVMVWVIRRVGVDKTLVLGGIFRAMCIFLFPWMEVSLVWFFVVAFFNGLTLAFVWVPYHYTVTSLSLKTKSFGSNTSYISIIEKLAGAAGPIIGGVIITYLGYEWLYSVSSVVLFFSAMAPLMDDFNKFKMHFRWKEIRARFKDKGIGKHIFAHGLHVFDINSYAIIWPLILFAGFGTVMKSGIFQSGTLLLSIVVLFWLSKYLDKGKYGVMKFGSTLSSVHWWLRYFINTPLGLAGAEVINGLGQVMLWTPFSALVYKKGSKGYKLEFFVVRQFIRAAWSIIIVSLLWLVFKLVSSLEVMMLVFGIIMVGTMLISKLFAKEIKLIKK